MKQRFSLDKQITKKPSKKILIIGIITLFLVVTAIITTLMVRHAYFENLKPVSGSNEVITVVIEKDSTGREIADLLKDKGLIRSSWAFQWYINNSNAREALQYGTYDLRPNQSVEQIVAQLTHGVVATKLVTIVPGSRIDQVKLAFIDSGYQPDEIDTAFDPKLYRDSPVLADMPKDINSLEGLLYPDSYQRDDSTSPETIIRQALDEMDDYLTPQIRQEFVKNGLTVYKGLILASIVEKEEPDPLVRPTVAQVFLKRIKEDIPLGSDPTAIYGVLSDGKTLEDIKGGNSPIYSAIMYDSPYNTYMHKGLPPTPIGTLDESAIKAVAYPSKTDYLFFSAGSDCKTRFTRTNAEHEASVEKYGLSTSNPECQN